MLTGTAIYVRNVHAPKTPPDVVEKGARALAKRAKAMGLSWIALGAVWQESKGEAVTSRFLNTPAQCHTYAKAVRDVGLTPYVWGYPWLGAEQKFIDGMVQCAGDDGLYLLDPELGMNPTRAKDMTRPNASAGNLVAGLRQRGAKVIGLSTFGGVPSWFPLDAFLAAKIEFAGGQTYSEDAAIDASIGAFLARMKKAQSTAQLVPNFGLYARNADGSARSKTPAELRVHLEEFINEGEPVQAMIGWAENFLTPALEAVLAEFSVRLREHQGRV